MEQASMGPLFFRAENRPPPNSLKDKGLQSGFQEVRHTTFGEPVVPWATGSNLLPKIRLGRASRPGISDGTEPLESHGTSKSATVPTPRHSQLLGTRGPNATNLLGSPQPGRFPSGHVGNNAGGASCFNGAALFQSGERDPRRPRAGVPVASMGPLFFRAENPSPSTP